MTHMKTEINRNLTPITKISTLQSSNNLKLMGKMKIKNNKTVIR